jgi:hypothetical protein
MKKILLSLGTIVFVLLAICSASTASILTSRTTLDDNTFSAGVWSVGPAQGDVVINEMMWMGSIGHTADEWIELRNTTSAPIDLSGWELSNNTGTETLMLTLPGGAIIPANGYYLIANYSDANTSSALNVAPDYVTTSVDLSNTALQIKLYDGAVGSADIIDTAGNGSIPLGGSNGANKQSMSRNPTSGDGTQAINWYTDATSNTIIYWDSVDGNYGTPGGPNV